MPDTSAYLFLRGAMHARGAASVHICPRRRQAVSLIPTRHSSYPKTQQIISEDTTDAASGELDAIAKVRELIKDVRIAMVTIAGDDAALHSRPMYAHQTECDGDFWFELFSHAAIVATRRADRRTDCRTVLQPDQRFDPAGSEEVIVSVTLPISRTLSMRSNVRESSVERPSRPNRLRFSANARYARSRN